MKRNMIRHALVGCLLLSSCCLFGNTVSAASYQDSLTAKATAQQLAQQETMGLLWMRTSAEYRGLCYQAYHAATVEIDAALADANRNKKPLAIILDCDETVVDNARNMGISAAEGNGNYNGRWWRNSVHQGTSLAMPGAKEFLDATAQKGIEIFYVTNRYGPTNGEPTIKNLKELGFPSVNKEHILFFEKDSNKQPRFDQVTAKYDVILYLGDNAGDFPLDTQGKTLQERADIFDQNKDNFGTKYIVLPNPAYGSWVSALDKNYQKMSPKERDEINQKYLKQ